MIAVSDEFKAIWQRKQGTVDRRRVGIKRRYWDGAAFVWEGDWTWFYEGDFVSIGVIPGELDSPLQNVFRTGVVTLVFNNERNQWLQSAAAPSIFAADNVALQGYRLARSQMRVQVGYELNGGTVEWVNRFTGYALKLATPMSDGTVKVQVASKAALLLEKCDASQVSEPVGPLELCTPDADGANKTFLTGSVGVDHLDDVEVGGLSLATDEYSAQNFNTIPVPGNDGKVELTMAVAPSVGQATRVSGLKWLRDKTIEYLLGLVCDVAGIAADERVIDPVVIPGDAAGSQIINTETEWEAYDSAQNITTTAIPGSIERKWWFVYYGHVTGTTHTPFTKIVGSWRFEITQGGMILFSNGFWVPFPQPPGFGLERNLNKFRFWSTATGYTGNYDDPGDASPRIVTITRTAAGIWSLYIGGVLRIQVEDHTVEQITEIAQPNTPGNFNEVYWSPELDGVGVPDISDAHAVYVFNLATTPSAMGILQVLQILNGGSVTYKTAGAPDNGFGAPGAWDALVAIAGNGQMQHAPRQWLKIDIAITPNGFDTPEIQKLVANFLVSTINVSLAVHSGLTGAAAFEQYAGLIDYETGDNVDGARFFRSKNGSTTPVVELDQENGVIEILDVDTGEDGVINAGVVRQGDFVQSYDGADAGEAAPTSEQEFGRCLPPGGEISLPSVVLANHVNIAQARARLAYQRNFLPKIKIRAEIWFVPWLEVGDPLSFSLYDHPLLRTLVANDPLQKAGAAAFSGGAAANVLGRDLLVKVLEYKPNIDTNRAEVLLEKILL